MSRSSMGSRAQQSLKGCEVSERRDMVRRRSAMLRKTLTEGDWRANMGRTRLAGVKLW